MEKVILEMESLLEQEAAYYQMCARCIKSPFAWFLSSEDLPEFEEANRALHLRDVGDGPDVVAGRVIAHFLNRGETPVIDVDSIAEQQGVGDALRKRGIRPVRGDRVVMRWTRRDLPTPRYDTVTIETIPNETGKGEAREWIEIASSDDVGGAEEMLWRQVAETEARDARCRLYLGRIKGTAVGACDLFRFAGWGRIDSVVTHPQFRRRGVASALVSHAVIASLTSGDKITYLFTDAGSDAERLYTQLGFERWQLNPWRRYRG